ncbi:MAG: serine--tRNA ligase [Candidatus Eisenbacteria bacterium]|nr:serine--tRNA ligase [Candidatus Eisenbacteria bacterium]
MLDLKHIRNDPDAVRKAIADKGEKADLERLLSLDEELRALIVEADELKQDRNVSSERIAEMKKKGEDASELISQMRDVSARIKAFDERMAGLRDEIEALALTVPNIPHPSVPVGKDEDDNVLVREWGEPEEPCASPRPHWEIGEELGILNLPAATKIAGSGFICFVGLGALLERALIRFMLDVHTKEHGYTEVSTPFLSNRDAMTGTGQLPKLEEDMYRTSDDDLFLIPTAEVPITNIHREEILDGGRLPVRYVGYSPCFRREAGSYGKDTRGLIRVHQFDKVEMVKFVEPETSYDELESLTANAEDILQRLGIPYRVKTLCTGDLSFAAAKCYDIDAWAPGVGAWLEVSSCSNFEDFQARRSGIRYRPEDGGKPGFVHTLNGSGLALPRTLIAVVENYQTPDGRVRIPEALRPYMDGLAEIA